MKKQYGVYEQFYESNCFGMMEIIDKAPKKFLVRFLDTGYETWADRGNVLAGKVNDPISKKNKLDEWKPYYEEFVNNAGQELVAFAKRGRKFKVKFKETDFITEAFIENVKAGKIKDPYSKSFLGIGYLGEFDKSLPYWKQAKQLWTNVMKRCYNPKDYMGYYGRAFVDSRWHCFANFLADLSKLENFQNWLEGKENGKPFNLDKDLKFPENKVYSKETCMFVSEYENKSAGAINARRLDKINGRYS